jgi:hypothetical protein
LTVLSLLNKLIWLFKMQKKKLKTGLIE